jgi:6,7-dimethyl-8-ribityllumazine synthase
MAGSAPPPRERTGARSQTARFAIVAARFNEGIVTRLVEGARHAFAAAKVPDEAVELHWVPGSFELPLAALRLAETASASDGSDSAGEPLPEHGHQLGGG